MKHIKNIILCTVDAINLEHVKTKSKKSKSQKTHNFYKLKKYCLCFTVNIKEIFEKGDIERLIFTAGMSAGDQIT